MRDVLPRMRQWRDNRVRFALARVVETWGSAPRRSGAAMVISEDGQVAGSVSGGCIEGEVIREAFGCLEHGDRRYRTFGVDSETAWSVGLSCGGQVSVLVQPFDPLSNVGSAWMDSLESGQPFTIRTPLDGSIEWLEDGQAAETRLEDGIFVHGIQPRERLVIIGGADIAVHLTALATRLDFAVTIIDPRSVFSDAARFDVAPEAVLTAWPQEALPGLQPDARTYAVLLTHDPRIDDPALAILFEAEVPYIGALGGRKTRLARRERLLAAGFHEDHIARIHGPVGLPIGARTPAEIAAAIAAELIAVRNGVVLPSKT